ncbi:site-specific integrase [Dactylosporangium sp. NPDC006015]|uniref:site-specific integrase n=1 Tax=Dactylosporangium sp. NPDC006015 TaxID=3154576 RepID=UPI0033ABF635
MAEGSIFKRCGCRDPHTDKSYGTHCPQLRRPNRSWNPQHGHWAYQLELPPTLDGQRRLLRRSGIATRQQAVAERDHARALLALAGRDRRRQIEIGDVIQNAVRHRLPFPDVDRVRQRLRGDGPLGDMPTVGEYLTTWLEHLTADINTIHGYESIVRNHLIPHLGDVPLDKLRTSHLRAMFVAMEHRNAEIRSLKASPDPAVRRTVARVRPTGPVTRQHIRAVLRKAINDALADELIVGSNPAMLVKTPADRALPIVWEDERVERWRATGEVPGPVMVWTAEQVATFLDYVADHDQVIHPMLHLMAYRGLRRGETVGLRDTEVRLAKRELTVNNQIAIMGHRTIQKPPKSRAGNRDIALDADTVQALTTYRALRATWRLAAGEAWPDTGLFFVRPDGQPWHPNAFSARFRLLARKAGMPPVRLHDLRHSAATIALDAGIDIKVVSEQLGHSTTTLTRDTYQSVTKQMHQDAADAVAARIAGKAATL